MRDVLVVDRDCEDFLLQPITMTGTARFRAHKLLNELTNALRSGIAITPFQVWNDPFKCHIGISTHTEVILITEPNLRIAGSIQQLVHLLRR
ncbi:hypothetical protein D3C74_244300 [compost metagenome]